MTQGWILIKSTSDDSKFTALRETLLKTEVKKGDMIIKDKVIPV